MFKVNQFIVLPFLHQEQCQDKNPTKIEKMLYYLPFPYKPHLVVHSNVVISTLSIEQEKSKHELEKFT